MKVNKVNDAAVDAEEEDAWLAGYFADGGHGRGRVKNIDFMRLRDSALHLLDPGPGKRILDVGCGHGTTMIYCGLQGAMVFGQDLDAVGVDAANRLLRRFKLEGEALCGNATRLEFPDNQFDGVISSDFVEHIVDEDKIAMLREARRVLKPGGVLVTKTPNLSYLRVSLWYKRMRALARLRNPFEVVIPHTPGTDDPQHIGLSTRASLTRCLLGAGFLNYRFEYAPLRRFGASSPVEILSTEIPIVRDLLSEDLICVAFKPISLSHFPD